MAKPGELLYVSFGSELLFESSLPHGDALVTIKTYDGGIFRHKVLSAVLAQGYWEVAPGWEPAVKNRYFIRTNDGQTILAIFRLVEDREKQRVAELIWQNNKWEPTDVLIGMLIKGEMGLEEANQLVINELAPYVDTSEYQFE